jgi:hypothetical protein
MDVRQTTFANLIGNGIDLSALETTARILDELCTRLEELDARALTR